MSPGPSSTPSTVRLAPASYARMSCVIQVGGRVFVGGNSPHPCNESQHWDQKQRASMDNAMAALATAPHSRIRANKTPAHLHGQGLDRLGHRRHCLAQPLAQHAPLGLRAHAAARRVRQGRSRVCAGIARWHPALHAPLLKSTTPNATGCHLEITHPASAPAVLERVSAGCKLPHVDLLRHILAQLACRVRGFVGAGRTVKVCVGVSSWVLPCTASSPPAPLQCHFDATSTVPPQQRHLSSATSPVRSSRKPWSGCTTTTSRTCARAEGEGGGPRVRGKVRGQSVRGYARFGSFLPVWLHTPTDRLDSTRLGIIE